MASFKEQILTGMVGPVILSHRYGKPYIRSKPSVVKNPRTRAQTAQRSKFKAVNAFISQNLDQLIRPYWNPEARRLCMSGQNLFCKHNTHAFDTDRHVDMTSFKLTSDNLAGLKDLNFERLSEHIINFSWLNNARDKKSNEQNQVKIFGLRPELRVEELTCTAIRQSETYTLELDTSKYTHLFLFFWNAKLELSSASAWTEL